MSDNIKRSLPVSEELNDDSPARTRRRENTQESLPASLATSLSNSVEPVVANSERIMENPVGEVEMNLVEEPDLIFTSDLNCLQTIEEAAEMFRGSDMSRETVPSRIDLEHSQQQGAATVIFETEGMSQMQVDVSASTDEIAVSHVGGTEMDIAEHVGVNFARTWRQPVAESELSLMDDKCGSLARNVFQWMSEIGVHDFMTKAASACFNSRIRADNIRTKVLESSKVDLEQVIDMIATEIKKALVDHIQSLHLQALVDAIVRYYARCIWNDADSVSFKIFVECLPALVFHKIRPHEVFSEIISNHSKYTKLKSSKSIFCELPGPHLLGIVSEPVEPTSGSVGNSSGSRLSRTSHISETAMGGSVQPTVEEIRIANEGINVELPGNIPEHPNHIPKVVKFKLQKRKPSETISNPVLPMSEPYCGSLMYVRECYPVYYKYIIDIFTLPKIRIVKFISITGTPGIGKSMFYNWFFDKYRVENPTEVIVCASFDREREFQNCVVFEPGKVPVRHCRTIPEIEDAMYLYDGPPRGTPPTGRMVAFVSPNDDWFRNVDKRNFHMKLYMKVWSLAELQEADTCLELEIGSDELASRYYFFGGLARYCLADKDTVRDAKSDFMAKFTNSLATENSIERIYEGGSSQMCHRVFHYEPVDVVAETEGMPNLLPRDKRVFPGSNYIIEELKNLNEIAGDVRKLKFIMMLRHDPSCASILGLFFESDGNKFIMYTGNEEGTELTVMKVISCKGKNSESEDLDLEISRTEYYPSPPNWPAVDAYAYKEGGDYLILFQATLQAYHDIKAKGIMDHIIWMEKEKNIQNLKERISNGEISLIFVFLIPEGSLDYTERPIQSPSSSQETLDEMSKKIIKNLKQYFFRIPGSGIYK